MQSFMYLVLHAMNLPTIISFDKINNNNNNNKMKNSNLMNIQERNH